MYLAKEEPSFRLAFWHIIGSGLSIIVFVGFLILKEEARFYVY